MSSSISRAMRADLPACQAINKASMAETYSQGFWTTCFNQFGDLFNVAKVDGKVAGYVLGRVENIRGVRTGLVVSVAVDKEYRGRGIGEALMKAEHYAFRLRNIPIVSLQVRKSNLSAMAMYVKLGYAIALSVPEYYSTPSEDGWLLSLVL